jgi:hypothetical protein
MPDVKQRLASQSGLKDLPDYNGHEQNRADEL